MYDDSFQALNILSNFKSIDTLTEQMNFVLILLYSLEGDKQAVFEAEIKKFEDILADIKFMRLVRHRDSLVKDYPSEYFGRDYGEGDPFVFNEQLEDRIKEIEIELMGVLGRVIKVMGQTHIVIGEDT